MPDSFKSQLQTVLRITRTSMRFRAPVETKVVKRKFKNQKDTGTTPDQDTAAAAPTLLPMKTKIIQVKHKFEDQEDTMRTPPQTPPPMPSPTPPRLTGA
jgi:hypothetical protein